MGALSKLSFLENFAMTHLPVNLSAKMKPENILGSIDAKHKGSIY